MLGRKQTGKKSFHIRKLQRNQNNTIRQLNNAYFRTHGIAAY